MFSRIREYQITTILGEGAFGAVCMGIHLKTNKRVAVKLESKNTQGLLKHETTVLRFLRSSGILGVPDIYYYGVEHPYLCLVMTYYEGSLANEIPQMTHTDIYLWWNQSINILQSIHDVGILHRDVKPMHFMKHKKTRWSLIDFGISSVCGDEVSIASIVGTPNWISPHIHKGISPSKRDEYISLWYVFLDACLQKQNDSLLWPVLDWSSTETFSISHTNQWIMQDFKSEENIRRVIEESALIPIEKHFFLESISDLYQLEFIDRPPYTHFDDSVWIIS